MDPNAIALLQQLLSNPQMVSQLQHILSATNAASGSGSSNYSVGDGYALQDAGTFMPSSATSASSSGSSPAVTTLGAARGQQHNHQFQNRQQQFHTSDARYKPPTAAAAAPASVSLQRYEQLEQRLRQCDQDRATADQRVEQLTALVAEQRTQQRRAEDRHELAVAELKHTFEAVLRRKDEVQEESLRQLLKSRQLFTVARRFEDTVRAQGGSAGLSDGAVPVNVRNNTKYGINANGNTNGGAKYRMVEEPPGAYFRKYGGQASGSAVKRERSTSEGNGSHDTRTPTAALKRTRAASTGIAVGSSVSFTVSSPRPTRTAATAATEGKNKSTTLLARSTTTTTATTVATSRKRRTPRTPSLTHADRLSRSPPPPPLTLTGTGGGLASIKLATPTPLPSAMRGRQQQQLGSGRRGYTNTTSHSHGSKVASYGYDSGSNTNGNNEEEEERDAVSQAISPVPRPAAPQQQRFLSPQYGRGGAPPLVTKVAGRLPPPVPHHNTNQQGSVVPNTCSGASSVVGGPTRSPSPVNPKRGPLLPRRFIFTGLKDPEPERLEAAIDAIGEDAMALAGDLDEPPPFSTTHIVVRGTPRSVKALCGVVAGKWLVPPEYITNSRAAGFWLDEFEEGGLRLFPPPLKCQRFLLSIEHAGIREKIAQVIEYGGGEVVTGSSSQGVVVITSGDDLLRYATQGQA